MKTWLVLKIWKYKVLLYGGDDQYLFAMKKDFDALTIPVEELDQVVGECLWNGHFNILGYKL